MNWYPHVPCDPIYPKLFENEKERIRKVLGNAIIEHFGSTSVKGLGGKGYIDIYVVVPKDEVEKTSKLLQEKLGYEFRSNAGNSERLFHQRKVLDKNGDQRIYHLHLTYTGNEGFEKDIRFRDMLRNNNKLAKKYDEIKRVASEKANRCKTKEKAKEVYMKIKQPVVNEVLNNLS